MHITRQSFILYIRHYTVTLINHNTQIIDNNIGKPNELRYFTLTLLTILWYIMLGVITVLGIINNINYISFLPTFIWFIIEIIVVLCLLITITIRKMIEIL